MLTAIFFHVGFFGVAWLLTVVMLAVARALLSWDANRERNPRCSMSHYPTGKAPSNMSSAVLGASAGRPAERRATITTQQAADMLGISRPTLIRLLDSGRIPFERPGAHRRLRVDDVTAFRASISHAAVAVPPPLGVKEDRQPEYAAGRPS